VHLKESTEKPVFHRKNTAEWVVAVGEPDSSKCSKRYWELTLGKVSPGKDPPAATAVAAAICKACPAADAAPAAAASALLDLTLSSKMLFPLISSAMLLMPPLAAALIEQMACHAVLLELGNSPSSPKGWYGFDAWSD
jgi:hypothetical protein